MKRMIALGLAIIITITFAASAISSRKEQAMLAHQKAFEQAAMNEAATFVIVQDLADEYDEIYELQKEFNYAREIDELVELNEKLDVVMDELDLKEHAYENARKEVLEGRREYMEEVD